MNMNDVFLRCLIEGKGFPTLRRFQQGVHAWFTQTFIDKGYVPSRKTKAFRFLEEALELVQVAGLTEEDVHTQAKYTFSRPVGEAGAEVAGTYITLQHVATELEVDAEDVALTELRRIATPEFREKILAKQSFKDSHGLCG